MSITTLSPPLAGGNTTTAPPGLDTWIDELPRVSLAEVAADPAATAVFAVDMVTGSREAERLGEPVAVLFQGAHDLGVRDFVLLQARRDTRNLAFSGFQSRAAADHREIEPVPQIRRLPFAADVTVIPTHSMDPAIGTGLARWLAEHPNLRTAIVVGVGADRAVYQAAMYLQMRAEALTLATFRVVVPTVLVAPGPHPRAAGATGNPLAPPGYDYDQVFLSHLALHGVRLVRALTTEETPS